MHDRWGRWMERKKRVVPREVCTVRLERGNLWKLWRRKCLPESGGTARTERRDCRLRDMIMGQCREKWMSWWDSRKPAVVCGEICGWWQAYFFVCGFKLLCDKRNCLCYYKSDISENDFCGNESIFIFFYVYTSYCGTKWLQSWILIFFHYYRYNKNM